jgi:hypothetical protein
MVYNVTPAQERQRETNFGSHHLSAEQLTRCNKINEAYKELYAIIQENTPPSREQSIAITELETSSFWAICSITRNEN